MLKNKSIKQKALIFVVLLGVVSLFGDMTYEGARSINGQFLQQFGTNAATVGWIAGLGELFGFGLRIFSGYISDKTRKYWAITLAGYALNLFSVPLLAFAGYWQIAAVLMISERIGKAIRTPARDVILSYGTKQTGHGWGFGFHEALDQIGAVLGPLLVSGIIFWKNKSYQEAYAWLFVPALLAMMVLIAGNVIFPKPKDLEGHATSPLKTKGFPRVFWIYLVGAFFVAAGYADFPLIAFHLKDKAILTDSFIPALYAMAMLVDAGAALLFGRWFDRIGPRAMMFAVMASLFFPLFVFLGNLNMVIVGMALWGIGMGAQESILRAGVATYIHSDKRGTAYGLFNTFYGLSWFLGSVLIGILYDMNIHYVVIFSMITQGLAILIFLLVAKKNR